MLYEFFPSYWWCSQYAFCTRYVYFKPHMAATVHLLGFGLAMQNRTVTLDTSRSKSSSKLMSWMSCRLEMLKHPQLCFYLPWIHFTILDIAYDPTHSFKDIFDSSNGGRFKWTGCYIGAQSLSEPPLWPLLLILLLSYLSLSDITSCRGKIRLSRCGVSSFGCSET